VSGSRHGLVIDRRNSALFRPIRKSRTELLDVEDVIPNRLMRVPGLDRFCFNLRTRPVRNWILPQIVKLSIAAA
jgi:hypothetical protein